MYWATGDRHSAEESSRVYDRRHGVSCTGWSTCCRRVKPSTTDVVSCFRHTLNVQGDGHAAEGSGRLRQTQCGKHLPGPAADRTDFRTGLPPPSSAHTCPLTSCPSRSKPSAPRWCTCTATLGQYSCPSTSTWSRATWRLAWLRKTARLTTQPPDSSLIKVCVECWSNQPALNDCWYLAG